MFLYYSPLNIKKFREIKNVFFKFIFKILEVFLFIGIILIFIQQKLTKDSSFNQYLYSIFGTILLIFLFYWSLEILKKYLEQKGWIE